MNIKDELNIGDKVESIHYKNIFGEIVAMGNLNLCINQSGHLSVINIADVRKLKSPSEKMRDRLIYDIEDTKEHSALSTANQIMITLTKYYDVTEKEG